MRGLPDNNGFQSVSTLQYLKALRGFVSRLSLFARTPPPPPPGRVQEHACVCVPLLTVPPLSRASESHFTQAPADCPPPLASLPASLVRVAPSPSPSPSLCPFVYWQVQYCPSVGLLTAAAAAVLRASVYV